MNKDTFIRHRKALLDTVDNGSMIILFAGHPKKKSADQEYAFTPNRNFYYLTGIDEDSVIYVAVKKFDGNLTESLYIKNADPFMEKWVGKTISKEEAKELSGIEDIRYVENFKKDVHFSIASDIYNVNLDLERDRFKDVTSYSEDFAKKLQDKYPYVSIKNIYNAICELRVCKDEDEVNEIRKAIEITKEGIESLMKNSKAGIKEYQLEAYFNFVLNMNGVKDVAFDTIAASGKNATVLHYVSNEDDLKDGDLILFDLGAQHNYYCGDISRTFPVNGKFTERQKQIYNIVLKAELETIKAIKPGVPFMSLNNVTKKVLAEGLKELGIIKEDSELSKYYYHGVSHNLGLDVHDVGRRDVELKEGMVLTVEPGLYIEEESIGIRIEDDILVTKDGCENLSKDIIKTVEEIEAFMEKK